MLRFQFKDVNGRQLQIKAIVQEISKTPSSPSLRTSLSMSSYVVVLSSILVITSYATPTCSDSKLCQRDANNNKTRNNGMSTEAVISLIGVVVAMLGIASSLAWSKRRSKSSRQPRGPSSTPDGAHPCCDSIPSTMLTRRVVFRTNTFPLSNI
jgi:hypothetical protein